MSLRAIALAFLILPACADPPTFVLAEGAATETSDTEPAADKEPPAETPANDDAGAPATSDASAPHDAGKGKGKGKGDND